VAFFVLKDYLLVVFINKGEIFMSGRRRMLDKLAKKEAEKKAQAPKRMPSKKAAKPTPRKAAKPSKKAEE
tara:strand:+ start:379 stop:588 length:210 start_codon:yes stop_codon:yes gene_type:complete